jgi:integrase
MINRRFLIVSPAWPSRGHAKKACTASKEYLCLILETANMRVVGFAAALRRSELVALDVEDVEFSRKGMVITVRRSKTDQEGHGQAIAVPLGTHLQPVRALRRWLNEGRIKMGQLFRPLHRAGGALPERLTRQSVALIVESRAASRLWNSPAIPCGPDSSPRRWKPAPTIPAS